MVERAGVSAWATAQLTKVVGVAPADFCWRIEL